MECIPLVEVELRHGSHSDEARMFTARMSGSHRNSITSAERRQALGGLSAMATIPQYLARLDHYSYRRTDQEGEIRPRAGVGAAAGGYDTTAPSRRCSTPTGPAGALAAVIGQAGSKPDETAVAELHRHTPPFPVHRGASPSEAEKQSASRPEPETALSQPHGEGRLGPQPTPPAPRSWAAGARSTTAIRSEGKTKRG